MKKYVKYLIITLVIGIMLAIGTYAYWSYESSNKKNISIQTSRELSNYIIYDEGESKFAGELKIGSSYLDGVHTTISIKKTNDASNLELIATVNMTVNAIGDNIKNSYGLKWAITKGDSTSAGTLLNQGNFYGKNNDDVIELKTGIEVTTTEEKYTVWIWIDGSENIDPKIVGETLDTSVWTQVDQILDNRFEVTSINSNYQFINASAVNTTKNIVAYAVTNTSSQPSSYTNLTTQEQGNVYNVVDYKVTNTGTYYVWFKDSAGNTVNKSVAVSKIDTTPPVCTFGNFEPSTIKNGETSVVELTCVDEEIGIKSSDITSSSITLNGSSATLNNNIEKTRITNGFKYKLTVTGTSTDGDTSLSLNAGVVNNKAGLSNSTPSSTPTVKVQNITNVAIPIQSGTLTYNSTSQTVTWSNYDSSKMTVSGTTSATNAGTYSATFTLKDTTKYRWPDGTSTAKTVSWTINKYNISNVDVGSISDQTYTGSAITPLPVLSKILNGSSKYTLVKDTDYTLSYSNNTNVGTATIKATGKGNFTGTKNVTFKIVAKSIAIPSQSGTLTYNKTSQSPSWSNYDSTKMTVSGTTSATNAGTYSATFTLKDTTNYKWSDGTTAAKTVSWTINKYNISNVDVGSISDKTYTGSAITPVPVLSKILNGSSKYTLVKDTDYTLSYSNNTNVGTATITATGKGNFTGTKNVTFKIVAKSIAIPSQSGTLTYNTASQSPSWSNYDSTKMTVSGTTSATNAGTYSATFTLKDTTNYKWSDGTTTEKTVSWKINKYNISNVDVGSISDQTYTGSAITPLPVLSKILNGSSKYTLVKDTDYTLSYSNNTNVGTATITATGKGNFTGTVSTTFKINKASLTVPSQSGTLTYNTASQTVTWSNYDSSKMTVSGTTSATNAGTYSATFTLKDTTNYKWSDGTTAAKTVSWTINKYNISNVDVGSISDKTYTGSAITPVPVLSKILNGSSKYTLVKDTDYTLSYSNNTNVGTATIKATGKGNFTGTKNVTFKIVAKSIAIPSQSGTLTYNTASQSPSWSNYDSSKMTVSGTTSATNAGTYSATFTLKNTTNYKWSDGTTAEKTVSWKINKYNISNVDVGSISDKTYTGSAITPLPVLSKILNGSSKYTLVKDTDYTLSYSNNTNVGTATIKATGKGNFTGTKNVTFKIVAKSIAIPSQSGTLTYNKTSQSPSWSNYDSSKITVSGTTSATNVGTYIAVFTLKDTTNYKWPDGTTTEKPVSWRITPRSITDFEISLAKYYYAYTGSAITPTLLGNHIDDKEVYACESACTSQECISDCEITHRYSFILNTDYTLSYSNNINAGVGTVIITGEGNFYGEVSKTFTIYTWKNTSKSTYYSDFASAVRGATAGDTIRLDASYTDSAGYVDVSEKNLTIDSNGKTLTFSNTGNSTCSIYLYYSTVTFTGTGTYSGQKCLVYIRSSTVSILSGNFVTTGQYGVGGGSGVYLFSGTLNLSTAPSDLMSTSRRDIGSRSSPYIYSGGNASVYIENGQFNMYGGYLHSDNTNSMATLFFHSSNTYHPVIDGGDILSDNYVAIQNDSTSAVLEITGSAHIGTPSLHSAINSTGVVRINGDYDGRVQVEGQRRPYCSSTTSCTSGREYGTIIYGGGYGINNNSKAAISFGSQSSYDISSTLGNGMIRNWAPTVITKNYPLANATTIYMLSGWLFHGTSTYYKTGTVNTGGRSIKTQTSTHTSYSKTFGSGSNYSKSITISGVSKNSYVRS